MRELERAVPMLLTARRSHEMEPFDMRGFRRWVGPMHVTKGQWSLPSYVPCSSHLSDHLPCVRSDTHQTRCLAAEERIEKFRLCPKPNGCAHHGPLRSLRIARKHTRTCPEHRPRTVARQYQCVYQADLHLANSGVRSLR